MAILREQGVNSHVEMSYAMAQAGFDTYDVHMSDLQAGRARLVCDFLAGMTDGYAARTYKRLFSPDFGSIGDLIG